jgi:S1/P1 Nuclease
MKRLLVLLVLWPSLAQAWNKPGHQVIGSIAYRSMQPEARANVIAILKSHPSYPDWQKKLADVPEADRDEYLFQLAGRWADDIRGKPEFDHPTWHYVNIPYERGKPDGTLPDVEGIIRALKSNKDALAGPEKAVALTWMFHLVEDIHQPLHVVKLVDDITPDGDKGGNLSFVRFSADARTVNLHQVWDGLLTASDRFSDCQKIAIELVERDKPEAGGGFEDWAWESYKLAKDSAYKDIVHSGDKAQGTVLPEKYGKESKAVGETRCLQAGLRLAKLLSDL